MEMLAVFVVVSFLLLLVSLEVLKHIDEARETVAVAETRMVYLAGQITLIGSQVRGLLDSDIEEGLSGTVIDDTSKPIQTKLSEEMLEAITLSAARSISEGTAAAAFTVVDGEITRLVYTSGKGRGRYTVTVENGVFTAERE